MSSKFELAITPSLITLNLLRLEDQVKALEEAGMEYLHVDILDGYFSPSMPLGLDTVRQLREITNLKFDCHIMVKEQQFFIDELLDIGVDSICFHIEEEDHVDRMLKYIKSKGVKAGVALKPATPLSVLEYVLDDCDMILLMLINPGYAGNKKEGQVAYGDRKIKALRKMIDQRGLDTKISIDGRISQDNIRTYSDGVVNMYVAGSTCLKKDNLLETAKETIGLLKGEV